MIRTVTMAKLQRTFAVVLALSLTAQTGSSQSNPAPATGGGPAVVRADAGHAISLPATAARLSGPSVRLNTKTQVAAWWKGPQDHAAWRYLVTRSDLYDIVLTWGAPQSVAGQTFHIEVDGKRILEQRVPATGGYDVFQRRSFGQLRLEKGQHELIFRPAQAVRGEDLLDLQSIRLIPHDPDRPPEPVPAPFRVPKGFEIIRAAGPPLVKRPLFASFDHQGRLYVADSGGVNDKSRLTHPPDVIRRLEDTDGDGVFDTSSIFADKITFAAGLLWHDGAVFVAAPPSLWKLEDTDGDGVADKRTELVTGFTNKHSCSDDFHGACLGPDGRVYFFPARFGHKIRRPGGKVVREGRGPWLMRCRTDGRDLEFVSGAMGNPVEVDFLPNGDFFLQGTFWAKPSAGGGLRDALVHGVEGGEYSVRDVTHTDRIRTGPFLPALVPMTATAPSGMMVYRSGAFGPTYRHNLFGSYFNTHKIQRHVLRPAGATYRATTEDFIVGASADVHFTDILEDADGSLLAVDTGGWFRACCPASKIARPMVFGGIYRVRPRKFRPAADPWGTLLAWDDLSKARPAGHKVDAAQLVGRLNDDRFAVRQRSTAALARRGSDAEPALRSILTRADSSARQRVAAVWTLCRIDGDEGRAATRLALRDSDSTVRQAACAATGLHRDLLATPMLRGMVRRDSQAAVRRSAASALGRIADSAAVPDLLATLRERPDRFLEHAVIYALIQINSPDTRRGLASDNPNELRGALVALDQMNNGGLKPSDVAKVLGADDAQLRQSALDILTRRPQWAATAATVCRDRLAQTQLDPRQIKWVTRTISSLANTPPIQNMVTKVLADRSTSPHARASVLDAIAASRLKSLPAPWSRQVEASLRHSASEVRIASLRAVAAHKLKQQSGQVAAALSNPNGATAERLEAARTLARLRQPLSEAGSQFLFGLIDSATTASDRLAAIDVVAISSMNEVQYEVLASQLETAGPIELPRLLRAFEHSKKERVGDAMLSALAKSRAADSLSANQLGQVLKSYPATVRQKAAPLLARLRVRSNRQATRLAEVESSVSALEGHAERGRDLFFQKAACHLCHSVNGQGGNLGPNLSGIGAIRARRDLLEAILFPSATFARGYETIRIITQDDETLMGRLERETPRHIELMVGQGTRVRVAREEIKSLNFSQVSLMPPGLDSVLSPQELRDVLAYLEGLRREHFTVRATPQPTTAKPKQPAATGKGIPPHHSIRLPGLHAYAQKSIAAGESIEFRVSSSVPYDLSVVRLGKDPNDRASDAVLKRFPSNRARIQPIHPGSYVHVSNALKGDRELTQLTLECWVRPFHVKGWQGLITQHDYPLHSGFGLFLVDDRVAFLTGSGGAYDPKTVHETEGGVIRPRQWKHIAATWDGKTKRIYIDGKLMGTFTHAGVVRPSGGPLRLGAYGSNGIATNFFNGDLAMCAMYERVLAEPEIVKRVADRGLSVPPSDNLLGCWPFTEERGQRVADVSGQNRHGRIVNRATWMIGGPSFNAAKIERHDTNYDPGKDTHRGHGLRLASDDLYNCRWEVDHRALIPADAKSGLYAGRFDFQIDGKPMRYHTTFIVRRPKARPKAPILVLCSSNTWLAYNSVPFPVNHGSGLIPMGTGGLRNSHPAAPRYSFYSDHRNGQPAYKVGLNVPWPAAGPGKTYMSKTYSHLVRGERFLHLWLDRHGYDYDVITDRDLHRNPEVLKGYKTVILNGHSEYWSARAYNAVDTYLRAGGSALVLSGNTMFWRVSFGDDGEVMECRKFGSGIGGRRFAQVGELYHSHDFRRGSLMRFCGYPAWKLVGLTCIGWSGMNFKPYTVDLPDHFLFNKPHKIDLKKGKAFGFVTKSLGAVGHEYDVRLRTVLKATKEIPATLKGLTEPAGITTIASSRDQRNVLDFTARGHTARAGGEQTIAEIIYWERPQGGRVFHTGSIASAWSMYHDEKLSLLVKNVLHHFGVQPKK